MNSSASFRPGKAARIPAPGTDYQVVASWFGGPVGARFTVLFGGRYFVVNEGLLGLIKSGQTPDDLELEEAEGDE